MSKPRKSMSLPAETVEYLKAWMMSPEHIAHPYPTEQEKAQIMADTGIELKQLTNWFVNNRKRYWKPRVEAQLQKQRQEGKTTVSLSTFSTPPPSPDRSPDRHYLSARVSIGSATDVFSSPSNAFLVNNAPHPRAVSVGSASSISSASDGIHSFDDEVDSVDAAASDAAASDTSEKIEIIDGDGLVKRSCLIVESEEDRQKPPSKRIRRMRMNSVHRIEEGSPRPTYRGRDTKQWRDVCRKARNGFVYTLPTLEEAAVMFGYSD